MKKLLTILLFFTLLSVAVLPAQAASGSMQLSASSTNLKRGDTFTLSVSLSGGNAVSNGGLVLSYNSSALELVSGSCNISGATGQVSAGNNGGVFAMPSDTVVSGRIFTITMRVKSDAPFGAYTISGSANLAGGGNPISCSVSGTTVNVVCSHNYGEATKVNDSSHKQICSICGDEKTSSHNWNAGEVIKKASCKETGTRKHTCSTCGATKEETIQKTNDHKYTSVSLNSSQHKQTCSVCGNQRTVNHTWNAGEVTKKASCKDTGTRKYTCTACGTTKTESIAKTSHQFTAVSEDADYHLQTCTVCKAQVRGEHELDTVLQHDSENHYYPCKICGHKGNPEPHEPGPKATEETDQICTVCERILKPKGKHEHEFSEEWSTNETEHWHSCSDCDEREAAAEHDFTNDCDESCDICGFTREPMHLFAEDWSADETGHWYECTTCGKKLDFAEHTPGEEATITTAQTCTVCAFELSPVVAHKHSFSKSEDVHRHICQCGEVYEAEPQECKYCFYIPWKLVCIGEAVLFGVILLIVCLVKRKKKVYEETF